MCSVGSSALATALSLSHLLPGIKRYLEAAHHHDRRSDAGTHEREWWDGTYPLVSNQVAMHSRGSFVGSNSSHTFLHS